MSEAAVAAAPVDARRVASTYAGYLRLDVLLQQQDRLTEPAARDELLFIVVHQICELLFKVTLDELEQAREALDSDNPVEARRILHRLHVLQRLTTGQLDLLDTMSPASFAEFRSALGTSSAFQSVQAREIEFLSGAKDSRYVRAVGGTPADRARLRRRLTEPSLWEAFEQLLARRWPAAGSCHERLLLLAHPSRRADALWGVAEDLLEYDRQAADWRARHVRLVRVLIGAKQGTAGSSGVAYLKGREEQRYFPLLWVVAESEAVS